MNAKIKNGKIHIYRLLPDGYKLNDLWDNCLCGIWVNETNATLTTKKVTCKNCIGIINRALED